MNEQDWDDFVDAYEDAEILELSKAVSGMTVEQRGDLWWAIPKDPGDPPMGFPFSEKEYAEEGICSMAFSEGSEYAKAPLPGV